MKPKKVIVKKLFNGCASIRSYIVEKCIEESRGLIISYNHFIMSVDSKDLDKHFRFHKIEFESKYNNSKYQLIDFKFKPDNLTG